MKLVFSRRRVFTAVMAVALAGAVIFLALWQRYRMYETYDVQRSFSIDRAASQNYIAFATGLLAYSLDGAQYYDDRGETVWNESYNMQSPQAEVSGSRLLLYDRGGSSLVVMSDKKELTQLSTTFPIVRADVSSTGTCAVLTQDEDTGYISIYDEGGGTVASGQVHLSQTGYPMSIAISDDGSRLIMSLSVIKSESVGTRINIYDFTDAGSRQKDNIIATFEYDDTVSPQTGFFSDGSAIAVTDSGAVLYTSGKTVTEKKQLVNDTETESVIIGNEYFALIHQVSGGERLIDVYDSAGELSCERTLERSYNSCGFIRDDLLMDITGATISLFDVTGRTKFSYDFPDEVVAFEAAGDRREYFLIGAESSQVIRLS